MEGDFPLLKRNKFFFIMCTAKVNDVLFV